MIGSSFSFETPFLGRGSMSYSKYCVSVLKQECLFYITVFNGKVEVNSTTGKKGTLYNFLKMDFCDCA